jgi:hypothetical protein
LKLQSQKTLRFDVEKLKRLAAQTRPGAARLRWRNDILVCVLAGIATGLLLVLIFRIAL